MNLTRDFVIKAFPTGCLINMMNCAAKGLLFHPILKQLMILLIVLPLQPAFRKFFFPHNGRI
jgi:hypothetical protein